MIDSQEDAHCRTQVWSIHKHWRNTMIDFWQGKRGGAKGDRFVASVCRQCGSCCSWPSLACAGTRALACFVLSISTLFIDEWWVPGISLFTLRYLCFNCRVTWCGIGYHWLDPATRCLYVLHSFGYKAWPWHWPAERQSSYSRHSWGAEARGCRCSSCFSCQGSNHGARQGKLFITFSRISICYKVAMLQLSGENFAMADDCWCSTILLVGGSCSSVAWVIVCFIKETI